MTMAADGVKRESSPGGDALWTAQFDEFMREFQAEEPQLFFTVNNNSFDVLDLPLSPAAIGFPPFLSNDTTSVHQSPQQQPANDLTLQRSNSKRPRGDDEAHDHKGKRNRKLTAGFPCVEGDCRKTFDRACDLSKHHKRVHTDKRDRPHQCTICEQRFCWPKDVKRHLQQVHSGNAGHDGALSLITKQEPSDSSKMDIDSAPPSGVKSPTTATSISWLARSLVMLKKLRLRSKSIDDSDADENYMLVTLDKKNFQIVDLNNVTTAESLNHQIAATLNIERQISTSNFLLHRFRSGSKLGEQLAGDHLMDAISKAERAKRKLKVFLTPKSGSSTQQASYFGGMSTVASPGSTFT